VEYDNTNLNAWLFAAECCKVMVNRNNDESADYARRAIAFLQQAERLNPDNPPMMLNIGFLYFRLNDCENTRKYLLPIKDFQGFGAEQKAGIAQCLNKCAG
jgi:tetratricopeptide (TPR) repeat protein